MRVDEKQFEKMSTGDVDKADPFRDSSIAFSLSTDAFGELKMCSNSSFSLSVLEVLELVSPTFCRDSALFSYLDGFSNFEFKLD